MTDTKTDSVKIELVYENGRPTIVKTEGQDQWLLDQTYFDTHISEAIADCNRLAQALGLPTWTWRSVIDFEKWQDEFSSTWSHKLRGRHRRILDTSSSNLAGSYDYYSDYGAHRHEIALTDEYQEWLERLTGDLAKQIDLLESSSERLQAPLNLGLDAAISSAQTFLSDFLESLENMRQARQTIKECQAHLPDEDAILQDE